jgi:hypothetical protein
MKTIKYKECATAPATAEKITGQELIEFLFGKANNEDQKKETFRPESSYQEDITGQTACQ